MISPIFGLGALCTIDISRTARRTEKLQKKQVKLQGEQVDLQKQQVELQEFQVELLSAMSGTMDTIGADIGKIRKLQSEALAIQQELLARDKLQAYLEEFIYQAEKLVLECSTAILHPVLRFSLVSGLIKYVGNEGISTPMIRGRDNKAAFDKSISQARYLQNELRQTDEVRAELKQRQAIEEEKKAIEEEKKARALWIGLPIAIGLLGLLLFACMLSCLGCGGAFR